MEVRLGVIYSPKELVVEIDQSPEELTGQIEKAIGATKTALLWLTDSKGRRIGIPADKLAYVEVAPDNGASKRVGFGL
jgi:Protein of unknown function (DUF3107)